MDPEVEKVHEFVDLVVQLERHHPDDGQRSRGIDWRRRRSVPATARRDGVIGWLVVRLRLDGDGDEVWNADDEGDDVDERYGDLSTGDVTIDGALTWVLDHYVPETPASSTSTSR